MTSVDRVSDTDLTREEAPDHRRQAEAEFERLYDEYAHRIIGLVRRFIADEDVVDDIVQETFLRAYNSELHLEYLDEQRDRDQWPWLAAVARNLSLDTLRKGKGVYEEDLDEEFFEIDLSLDDPEVRLLASRRREGIAEALDAVSKRQRRILILKHLHGLDYRDIAAREGVSVAALKSAMARARRTFRDAYATVAERSGLGVIAGGIVTRVQVRLRSWRNRILGSPDATATAMAASPAAANALTTLAVLGTVGALGALGFFDGPSVAEQRAEPVVSVAAPVDEPTAKPDVSLAAAAAPETSGEASLSTSEPVVRSEPEPEPVSDTSTGATEAGASVNTDEVVPVDDPPASGSAEADVRQDEGGIDVNHAEAVDLDGDENPDSSGHGGADVECPPPDERGLVKSQLCPVLDDESGQSDPLL